MNENTVPDSERALAGEESGTASVGDASEKPEASGDESSKPDSTVSADAAAAPESVVSAPSPAAAPAPTPISKLSNSGKVKVHFVAVGSAPLMKKTKFAVASDQRFSFVISFLRRMLKLANNSGDSLFLYVNSAFVPSPDELVGDLNECFSVRGELVVHYALQEAWG